ncbi:MAG: GNAT family N-acetyltransferase [Anaerolineae bacterium]
MQQYKLAPHSQRPPSVRELTELTLRSFAAYHGVIEADDDFTGWFLRRPGMDPSLSWAAWHGDTLAASLFVTSVPLLVRGEAWQFGVVDTVMTHPNHRRQGLARALLQQTIAASRDCGLAALQLYTAPGSAGYQLYLSLGFRPLRHLRYWQRQPSHLPCTNSTAWSKLEEGDWHVASALIESLSDTYDGVPRLNEPLWRWRKLDRPASIAAKVWVVSTNAAPAGTATSCPVLLTGEGQNILLNDLVLANPGDLCQLCSDIGQNAPIIAIADTTDDHMQQALQTAAFASGQEEAVMFLPLGQLFLVDSLAQSSRPWFALTESIIGV